MNVSFYFTDSQEPPCTPAPAAAGGEVPQAIAMEQQWSDSCQHSIATVPCNVSDGIACVDCNNIPSIEGLLTSRVAPNTTTGEAGTTNNRASSLLMKANGGIVVISEDARRRSAEFLAKSNGDPMTANPPAGTLKGLSTQTARVSSLLQKANGGSVTISNAAMKKGEQWINGGDGKQDCGAPAMRSSSLLQKANGTKVSIPESARKKAVSFLEAFIDCQVQAPSFSSAVPITPKIELNNQQNRISSLLKTANGGSVVISDAARQRGSNFINSLDPSIPKVNVVTPLVTESSSSSSSAVFTSSSLPEPMHPPTKPSLLQKANGKHVVISEEAKQKGSKWLAKGGNNQSSQPDNLSMNTTPSHSLSSGSVLHHIVTAPSSYSTSVYNVPSSSSVPRSSSLSSSSNDNTFHLQYATIPTPYGNASGNVNIYDAFSQLCESSYQSSLSQSPLSKKQSDKTSTSNMDDEVPHVDHALQSHDSFIQRTLFQDDCMHKLDKVVNHYESYEQSTTTDLQTDEKMSNVFPIDSQVVNIHTDYALGDQALSMPIKSWFVTTPRTHGISTPCTSIESFLRDPIWPEEVASWDEILNRCYERKVLSVNHANELNRLSSAQVLASLQITNTALQVTENGTVLVSEATDKGDFSNLSKSFQNLLESKLSQYPILSKRWVLMQLNWIVWTLVSHRRQFPAMYSNFICSLENIELCLQRRIELYYFKKSSVEESNDVRISSTVTPSYKHFLKTGTMSPLQRCCEIINLVWPICVCISISFTSSVSNAFAVQITDGWFWARAIVDKGVEDLIQKGKLRDGYKIIIFLATITSGESPNSAGTVKLCLNCIRLAHKDASLGFINPRFLRRGLSLKSITTDGGAIFGIRFEAVAISNTYNRVKLLDKEGELLIDGITVNTSEINWIKTRLEDLQEKELAKMLSAEANQQQKRRKVLHDDEDDANCFKNNYSSTNDFKFESLFNLEVTSFQDILIKCELSGSLAWIKVSSSGGDDCDFADRSFRFTVGNKYFITNVKAMRSYSSTVTLITQNQSSLTTLTKPKVPMVTPQRTSAGQLPSKASNTVIFRNRMKSFTSLSTLLRSRDILFADSASTSNVTENTNISSYTGGDVSVKLIVVDWFEDGPLSYSVSSMDNTEWCSIVNLRILCVDESNYSVEILYPTFKKQLEKLPWLKKHKEIFAEYLSIKEVDTTYHIVRAIKTDRTTMTVVTHSVGQNAKDSLGSKPSSSIVSSTVYSSSNNSHGGSESLSQSLSQSQGNQISGKKKKFVTPRSTKKPMMTTGSSQQSSLLSYTTSSAALPRKLQLMCEEESHRFASLRSGHPFYSSQRLRSLELTTVRTTCVGFLERYPIVDLSSHFPDWRTVIVHMCKEVVIALCESTDVEMMIPEISRPIEGVITMQKISEAIELFSKELNQSMLITHVVIHTLPTVACSSA